MKKIKTADEAMPLLLTETGKKNSNAIEDVLVKGKTFEADLITLLRDDLDLETSERIDKKYKYDFVVKSINNINKYINIGVQLTIYLDKYDKILEFKLANSKKFLVDKGLYIEVDPDADIGEWVRYAILSIIKEFSFNSFYKDFDIYGFRISSNFTYESFDLNDRITQLIKKNEKGQDDLFFEGTIYKYFPEKGFGFVWGEVEKGKTESIFFHINNSNDNIINKIKEIENYSTPITVEYKLVPSVVVNSLTKYQCVITKVK